MHIEKGTIKHIESWVRFRAALWPDHSVEDHREELMRLLSTGSGFSGFIALSGSGEVIGFAEVALRHDYVNGCASSPVAFLEGIYVRPEDRRNGVAQLLCDAIAGWGKLAGCTELASDAPLENKVSHSFHAALGFEETERVVFFRRRL